MGFSWKIGWEIWFGKQNDGFSLRHSVLAKMVCLVWRGSVMKDSLSTAAVLS